MARHWVSREETNPFACVLRVGGTTLRVTKVEELRPQPFTVLGWEPPNVADTMRDLTTRGVVRSLRGDGPRYGGSMDDSRPSPLGYRTVTGTRWTMLFASPWRFHG